MTVQLTPPTPPFEPPTQGLPVQRVPGRSRSIIAVTLLLVALVAGLSYAAVLLVRGASGGAQAAAPAPVFAPTSFEFTGSLTLATTGLGVPFVGTGDCSGSGGYADITAGASVTVTDAAGTIVETSSLGPGTVISGTCEFSLDVPKVPEGSAFYSVEVSHRGKVTYSSEQLHRGGSIGMSLGS